MKSTYIFIISFAFLISSLSSGSVIAQNQSQSQNQSSAMVPENQTIATISDSPQTIIVNQTTVPIEQTTVTVNQTTTKPIHDQSQFQPLENQTVTSESGNFSNIENKTIVQATGPATTTIVNKTIVPFNQTTIGTDNTTID
ncbi:MAG TPA: hypothetical protein VD815_00255 [Candidatus Saccharimonadales bacterium]|nr:hypothetical protein [Candidatus Saccharimonadales bacterium]